jgi:hypothetical protein
MKAASTNNQGKILNCNPEILGKVKTHLLLIGQGRLLLLRINKICFSLTKLSEAITPEITQI